MTDYFTIDHVHVPLEIFTAPFACNVEQCKGACCTIPDCYGAPLEPSEIDAIESVLPHVEPLLSSQAREVIAESGWYERAPNGTLVTATVGRNECVFAVLDSGIARCALQIAYERGWSNVHKPLSCHLFPVRRLRNGRVLSYDRYPECRSAVKYGAQTGSTVFSTVRAALERAYGTEWVDSADRLCMSITGVEEPCHD